MSIELEEERLIEKAELVMAVRGYKNEERKRCDEGIDYVASHAKSDDKILLRIVTPAPCTHRPSLHPSGVWMRRGRLAASNPGSARREKS